MFAQVGGTLSGGDPVHRAPKRLSNERDIFAGLAFSRRGEPRLVRSVRHSRAVSTPPVRSVHPMDPIGSVGRGWLMAASHPRARPGSEHHSAFVVLGDVAVRHPESGVGDVEQDVDGFARAHEYGVFPGEVGLDVVVAGEYEEAAGSVDVEGVVHRVIRVHLVEQADLDLVADPEAPLDGTVLGSCCRVNQLPAHVGGGRDPVDLDHVVFPLDASGLGVTVFPTLVGVAVVAAGTSPDCERN